jgi:hypothetical protein
MQVYALALVELSPASLCLDSGLFGTSLEVSSPFFPRSTLAYIMQHSQHIPPASHMHASLINSISIFFFFFGLHLT